MLSVSRPPSEGWSSHSEQDGCSLSKVNRPHRGQADRPAGGSPLNLHFGGGVASPIKFLNRQKSSKKRASPEAAVKKIGSTGSKDSASGKASAREIKTWSA